MSCRRELSLSVQPTGETGGGFGKDCERGKMVNPSEAEMQLSWIGYSRLEPSPLDGVFYILVITDDDCGGTVYNNDRVKSSCFGRSDIRTVGQRRTANSRRTGTADRRRETSSDRISWWSDLLIFETEPMSLWGLDASGSQHHSPQL